MDSSQPVKRTLKVLEFCAVRGAQPATLKDIGAACDIAPATLARIAKTLEAAGYIEQVGRHGYISNLSVKRILPMPGKYLSMLRRVLQDLADQSAQSAETIVLEGDELVWHSRKEHADLGMLIRAHPGFRGGIYELDAPSRMVLAAMGMEQVREQFDVNAFFTVNGRNDLVSEEALAAMIINTDPTGIEYDPYGNVNGVRRFCKMIFDADGAPLHLLCIAEAARMNLNIQAHAAKNIVLLEKHAERLSAAISSSTAPTKDSIADGYAKQESASRHV